MGWFFSNQTRSELIKELTRSEEHQGTTRTCLRHTAVGNVLWTVWEVSKDDGTVYRYIGCDLLARSGSGWGHKPMDESMEPYYYSCPLAYLDMVPEASPRWREQVRAWHAARNRRVEVGDVLIFEGLSVPRVRVVEKKGRRLTGEFAGCLYNLPPKVLARVVEHRKAGAV